MVAVFRRACRRADGRHLDLACLERRPRPISMPGVTPSRRIAVLSAAGAIALVLSGCAGTAASNATPTPTPSASSSAADSPTLSPPPSPSGSASVTPTPSGIDPGFVPALAAIQMVGPRLGWAVGAYAIFATTDGAHWTKQY